MFRFKTTNRKPKIWYKFTAIFSKSTKILLDLLDLDTNIEIFGNKAGKPVYGTFLAGLRF